MRPSRYLLLASTILSGAVIVTLGPNASAQTPRDDVLAQAAPSGPTPEAKKNRRPSRSLQNLLRLQRRRIRRRGPRPRHRVRPPRMACQQPARRRRTPPSRLASPSRPRSSRHRRRRRLARRVLWASLKPRMRPAETTPQPGPKGPVASLNRGCARHRRHRRPGRRVPWASLNPGCARRRRRRPLHHNIQPESRGRLRKGTPPRRCRASHSRVHVRRRARRHRKRRPWRGAA